MKSNFQSLITSSVILSFAATPVTIPNQNEITEMLTRLFEIEIA